MTPRGAVGRKRRDTSPTIAGQPLVTLVMVVVVCTVGCVRDVRACGCGCGSWSCAPCSVRGEIAQDTLGGSGGARAALERLCVIQRVIISGHFPRIEFFRILPKI